MILTGRTLISPDGWDYVSDDNDVDLHPDALIECDECHYEDYYARFLED